MTCRPNDNSLNPPNLGPPPDLGFGPIFSPPQIPFPDLSLPEGIPEDILELLERIFAYIPGGKLIPSPDGAFDSVYDAIESLLSKLSPYLAFYNFIQALLNMIICIIEVLCALMSPFKTIRAVRKLFKQCIPDFLAMFPFLALLAMILAFILLLIALIEYLINTIIAFINDIIENINNLAEAFKIGNAEGIIAITIKLSQLLCLIEQLFALLIVFQVLFVIIRALAEIGGIKPCKRGDSCCDEETCPEFIGDNPDGTFGTGGRLVYHRRYGLDVSGVGIPGFENLISPLRSERWQFVDDNNPQYPFNLIVTPAGGSSTLFPFGVSDAIFWPQPQTYDKDDSLTTTVPYTVDMRLEVDPTIFGHGSTNGSFSGTRFFQINNIIVSRQPYNGVLDAQNDLTLSSSFGNSDGTLNLIGGKVFEDDGTTPFFIGGEQASLDTFISLDPVTASQLPVFEDGYQISNISWNMKINHAVLMKYQIITAGCIPEIQTETEIMDTTIPTIDPVITQIGGELPDLDTALECLNSAVADFRKDISIEKAAEFQNSIVGCLEDLRDQSIGVFTNTLLAGISLYNSDVELDPDIQFIDKSIQVSVNLKDSGGNELANSIPEETQAQISDLLEGHVTLGEISDFTYDGYSLFLADITSSTPGAGTLQVSFDDNFFSEVLNRDDADNPSEISIITLPYEFVGVAGSDAVGRPDPLTRRNETDVSKSD